jgi:3,5-epimerase/4-reductase
LKRNTKKTSLQVASYKHIYDVPNSVSVLPDILPLMVDLMRRRFVGALNMTSPGAVRHSDTLTMCVF